KTDPIYMINPYQKEMDASIVEVIKENSEIRVVLDKTVFYPMGGGQPTDQGKLILKDGSEVEVYQVMIKDGEINHYIKTEKDLKAGDSVKGKIDWDRRFKHMKTHSAGHVIDFAIYILGYSPDILTPQKGDHGKK